MSKAIYDIIINNKQALASLLQVNKAADSTDNKLKGVGKSGSNSFSLLGKSSMIAVGGLLAVGTAMSSVVNTNMQFEKQMSVVQAVTGSSAQQMKVLESAALKMGSTTAFTAQQAGQGLEFLGMAGLNANQSVAVLPDTLNLAAASGLELGRSADIMTNIMSQFGIKASGATRTTDVLAKTVTSSNQNMEQMADAMNYLGPTAKAMGMSLEDSSTIVATMANNGLQGSLGTRALGTAMVRLTKPTKQMKEKMKELNLEFFNEQDKFIGLIGLTKELENKTAGLTDKQKQNALATLFGAEAIQEMNILLATGSDKLSAYRDSLLNARGEARRMAETRLDNLEGDLTKLSSAFEGLVLKAGPINQVLRKAVQWTTNLVNAVSKVDSVFEGFFRKTGKGSDDFFKDVLESGRVSKSGLAATGGDSTIKGFLTSVMPGGQLLGSFLHSQSKGVEVSKMLDPFKDLTEGEFFNQIKDTRKSFLESFTGAGGAKADANKVFEAFVKERTMFFESLKKADEKEITTTPQGAPTAGAAGAAGATTQAKTRAEPTTTAQNKNVILNITNLANFEALNLGGGEMEDMLRSFGEKVAQTLIIAANDAVIAQR